VSTARLTSAQNRRRGGGTIEVERYPVGRLGR